MTSKSGTFRESDGQAVEMSYAKALWTPLARQVLEQVARTYHALTNYGELAEEVQAKSGVRTRQLIHYWIGDVLGEVGQECFRRGEPLLSSLCVQQSGLIGDGYGVALSRTYGGSVPADLDAAAAEERLKCYRYFGAKLPPDGGVPALTPQVAAKRRAAAKSAVADIRRPVCPTCYLTLPATGQCDYCS